ncbi:MAG: type II toxin-antitoxin system YafQ family toxin [Candidatus Margulisbacteria bacterium]|jgi:mRNA interferase YafQ|nr:type II toxin-antitoxin system YafQ family toxin [Candidatus Margulisiibacteriota bacterium]
MLSADYTKQFRKDYKLAMKRGLTIDTLDAVIGALLEELPLSAKYRDHNLTGNYKNYRECHIQPDWLLIYRIENGMLVLYRTGSHADLFR